MKKVISTQQIWGRQVVTLDDGTRWGFEHIGEKTSPGENLREVVEGDRGTMTAISNFGREFTLYRIMD